MLCRAGKMNQVLADIIQPRLRKAFSNPLPQQFAGGNHTISLQMSPGHNVLNASESAG
jgi:hypothetical protein